MGTLFLLFIQPLSRNASELVTLHKKSLQHLAPSPTTSSSLSYIIAKITWRQGKGRKAVILCGIFIDVSTKVGQHVDQASSTYCQAFVATATESRYRGDCLKSTAWKRESNPEIMMCPTIYMLKLYDNKDATSTKKYGRTHRPAHKL